MFKITFTRQQDKDALIMQTVSHIPVAPKLTSLHGARPLLFGQLSLFFWITLWVCAGLQHIFNTTDL